MGRRNILCEEVIAASGDIRYCVDYKLVDLSCGQEFVDVAEVFCSGYDEMVFGDGGVYFVDSVDIGTKDPAAFSFVV